MVLETGLQSLSKTVNISNSHFIYAGAYYFVGKRKLEKLKSMILTQMKQFKIRSAMLTLVDLVRDRLITKVGFNTEISQSF